MALTLDEPRSGAGGDFLPIVTYAATTGEWLAHNSENDGSGWVRSRAEIDVPTKVVMDLDNIEEGWILIGQGHVDMAMAKHGEGVPDRPSVEHKAGFRITLGNKSLGLRQFSHTAKTVRGAISKLHDQWIRERGDNPGKLPVVEIGKPETIEMDGRNGVLRFKAPVFSIVGWTANSALDKLANSDGSIDTPKKEAAPPPPPPPKPLVEQDDDELF